MTQKTTIITLLCITACLIGCDKPKTASQQIDKLTNESKEAAQDMKDFSYAQKEEFVSYMQNQITDLERGLDKLSDSIESSSDSVKAEAKPKLKALREQAAGLNLQLADVKNASESTWDTVKAASKKTYAAVAESFQQSREWVSDKIKP